jgi:formylglycine-generating enzyme required for sulfatase activity
VGKKILLATVLAISWLGLSCFAACPTMDRTGDCRVDFRDFAEIANQWLGIDFADFSLFTGQWLTEGVPAEPNVMAWVSISEPNFTGQMSKYETTNAQYCGFLNDALATGDITVYTDNVVYAMSDTNHLQPYFVTESGNSESQITYSGGTFSVRVRDSNSMADHPVVMVSWYGATAFCSYYGYRLPTEWEWQAVADYDGSYTYGCGTSIDQNKANYSRANPLNLTSQPFTSPVGYYPAYGYEMCDMAGNVWEWTSTVLYPQYEHCVIRGNGWINGSDDCMVSKRINLSPYIGANSLGFRVCR